MKSGFGKLVIFIFALSAFFTFIGVYFLPQSKSMPPVVIEIKAGISQEELLKIGEDILFGKGQCMVCHPNAPESGMRAPAIATIGADMAANAKKLGVPNEEYVMQALMDTKAVVAAGFAPIMPPTQKLLTEGELIAIAAYLQSKGAEVTISYPASSALVQKYMGAKAATAVAEVKLDKAMSPEQLAELGKKLFADKGGCMECHPEKKNPDLTFPILPELAASVAKHAAEKGEDPTAFLFQSMVKPAAYVAEGMDDVMPAAQDSLGEDEIIAVAAYIQSQGGKVTVSLDSLPVLKQELEKAGGK